MTTNMNSPFGLWKPTHPASSYRTSTGFSFDRNLVNKEDEGVGLRFQPHRYTINPESDRRTWSVDAVINILKRNDEYHGGWKVDDYDREDERRKVYPHVNHVVKPMNIVRFIFHIDSIGHPAEQLLSMVWRTSSENINAPFLKIPHKYGTRDGRVRDWNYINDAGPWNFHRNGDRVNFGGPFPDSTVDDAIYNNNSHSIYTNKDFVTDEAPLLCISTINRVWRWRAIVGRILEQFDAEPINFEEWDGDNGEDDTHPHVWYSKTHQLYFVIEHRNMKKTKDEYFNTSLDGHIADKEDYRHRHSLDFDKWEIYPGYQYGPPPSYDEPGIYGQIPPAMITIDGFKDECLEMLKMTPGGFFANIAAYGTDDVDDDRFIQYLWTLLPFWNEKVDEIPSNVMNIVFYRDIGIPHSSLTSTWHASPFPWDLWRSMNEKDGATDPILLNWDNFQGWDDTRRVSGTWTNKFGTHSTESEIEEYTHGRYVIEYVEATADWTGRRAELFNALTNRILDKANPDRPTPWEPYYEFEFEPQRVSRWPIYKTIAYLDATDPAPSEYMMFQYAEWMPTGTINNQWEDGLETAPICDLQDPEKRANYDWIMDGKQSEPNDAHNGFLLQAARQEVDNWPSWFEQSKIHESVKYNIEEKLLNLIPEYKEHDQEIQDKIAEFDEAQLEKEGSNYCQNPGLWSTRNDGCHPNRWSEHYDADDCVDYYNGESDTDERESIIRRPKIYANFPEPEGGVFNEAYVIDYWIGGPNFFFAYSCPRNHPDTNRVVSHDSGVIMVKADWNYVWPEVLAAAETALQKYHPFPVSPSGVMPRQANGYGGKFDESQYDTEFPLKVATAINTTFPKVLETA